METMMPHPDNPTRHQWRDEFALDQGLVYLNHAAIGPWPRRTARAVEDFAQHNLRRSASDYGIWLKTESELRRRLAWLLGGAEPDDLSIMKNTSEGISVVAQGLAWRAGENVVLPRREFPANRAPWLALASRGVEVREVDDRDDGLAAAVVDACDEKTRLIAVSSVQFDSGERLDLELLGDFCRAHDILLLLDVIQSLGVCPLALKTIRPHFVAGGVHKWLLAPEGVGYLYTTPESRDLLSLHQHGWRMGERPFDFDNPDWTPAASGKRFEPGTLNTIGMIGLNASLSLFEDIGIPAVEAQVLANSALLMEALENIGGVSLVTPREPERHAGIVSMKIGERTGLTARDVDRALRKQNIVTAARSGLLRLSPHFYTPREHLLTAVEVIGEILVTA